MEQVVQAMHYSTHQRWYALGLGIINIQPHDSVCENKPNYCVTSVLAILSLTQAQVWRTWVVCKTTQNFLANCC